MLLDFFAPLPDLLHMYSKDHIYNQENIMNIFDNWANMWIEKKCLSRPGVWAEE